MNRSEPRSCSCGSNKPSAWQYDARGIALCRTCEDCHQRKMAGYRREVLTDPEYDPLDDNVEEDE
jgi:hypothetical protein